MVIGELLLGTAAVVGASYAAPLAAGICSGMVGVVSGYMVGKYAFRTSDEESTERRAARQQRADDILQATERWVDDLEQHIEMMVFRSNFQTERMDEAIEALHEHVERVQETSLDLHATSTALRETAAVVDTQVQQAASSLSQLHSQLGTTHQGLRLTQVSLAQQDQLLTGIVARLGLAQSDWLRASERAMGSIESLIQQSLQSPQPVLDDNEARTMYSGQEHEDSEKEQMLCLIQALETGLSRVAVELQTVIRANRMQAEQIHELCAENQTLRRRLLPSVDAQERVLDVMPSVDVASNLRLFAK